MRTVSIRHVYVAAASSDLDRAERWMRLLGAADIGVTSTWVDVIRASGLEGNPRDATQPQRRDWSDADLNGVRNADLVWFLVNNTAPARGAYFECGYARGLDKVLVFSGDTKQSIFPALGQEYAEDIDAFAAICRMAKNGALL